MAKKTYTLDPNMPKSLWETMVSTPNLSTGTGPYNFAYNPNSGKAGAGSNPASVSAEKDTSQEGDIYSQINKMSLGLAGFETVASLFGAVQSLAAKEPTVTRPKGVVFQKPRIESSVASAEAMIKENMGTGINTVIERARETGVDVSRVAPGIFGQASRAMREGAVDLSQQQQGFLNQREVAITDTVNKEAAVNAEIENQYIARKDQVLSQDSYMRGVQLSQSISNLGGIFGRVMNERLMTNILKDGQESDKMYYNMMMMNNLLKV